MKRRTLYILLLLCVAMLLPSVASAQFFAKQKVAVWQITDRNNDVKVAEGTKQQIRTSMVDAFVNSRNYEAFEVNMNDVLNHITSQGLSRSRGSIAKVIGEKYGVNYVIFTTIQIIEHSTSYEDFKVHLASDFISTDTQKSERVAYVDMKSDVNEIPSACAELLSKLIGEELSVPAPPQQVAPQSAYQQPSQPTYQQPAQPPVVRSNVEVVYGYLKVFPNELGKFSAEPTVVINQINKQGMHDYDSWRLPTDEELALIRNNGLAGGDTYMTSSTSSSEGIVLLVTDASETYSEKQTKLAKEEEERRLAEEKRREEQARLERIKYGGMGNNGEYEIGYIYKRNGIEGVVFAVSSDGKRGKIISLEETEGSWNSAKTWCANLGGDWRLPTRQDLQMISKVKDNQDFIDGLFFSNSPKLKNDWYWTGEEYSGERAWLFFMYDGNTINNYKIYYHCVRAVSAF